MKPKRNLYVNSKYAGKLSDRELYSASVKILRACCGFRDSVVLPNGDEVQLTITMKKHRKRARRHK
jgi:hypothetical protein